MRDLCFLLIILGLQTNAFAQNYLAANDAVQCSTLADNPQPIQIYYEELLEKYGRDDRYRACELALERYASNEEEYAAKLYNILAEEAVLMQDLEMSKTYYQTVLQTNFKPDRYTEGLVAERAKIEALAGLRNIAMQEKDFGKALQYHQSFVDSLDGGWSEIAQQSQLKNDKIFATCYQMLGESEKAIDYLAPYIFGRAGDFDKEIVDYLADLLRTKYSKKEYKKFLNQINHQIFAEQKDGRVRFYLEVFYNKIYFQNDSANYEERVAQDETLKGEAIAHYQRKFFNSYFYQALVR